MSFDVMEELFYLKDTRTNKYHSFNGLVEDKDKASQFTEIQLKRRLNVPKTHNTKFKKKLEHGYLVMEPVKERIKFSIEIISDHNIEDDDILFCEGEFFYEKDLVLKKNIVYSKFRGNLREPKDGKGDLLKVKLRVIKKIGKIVKTSL